MASHTFDLFADYFQFYLQDEEASGIDGDSWNDEATERMLAVAPGALAIGTVRNVDVPISVEILESEPPNDLENWDHVTECSLVITSGKLVIAGCTDYFPDAARIDVAPGTYRARISGGGFDSVAKHWDDGEDMYRVQLWPGTRIEIRVLKLHPLQSS
ncbi:MAG: hypothetical protein EOP21_00955 [Hyphomicrobiales bacterium]|nr:MAG: hypothetical protein EOP21_00955 [Hyphomicrobiales bacterium]